MTKQAGMVSLFGKMTNTEENPPLTFDDSQARMIVEFLIPKLIMDMPMMKAHGFTCSVSEDERGWNVRIDRP
jgi:hypothetical protein